MLSPRKTVFIWIGFEPFTLTLLFFHFWQHKQIDTHQCFHHEIDFSTVNSNGNVKNKTIQFTRTETFFFCVWLNKQIRAIKWWQPKQIRSWIYYTQEKYFYNYTHINISNIHISHLLDRRKRFCRRRKLK